MPQQKLNSMKKLIALFIGSVFLFPVKMANAIDLTVSDWSCSLAEAGITNAGDYFDSELEPDTTTHLSCTSATASISGLINDTDTWDLSAKLNSAVSGVTVEIKRNGTGSGINVPSGGNNFITLTTANQTFFSGTGNIDAIPLLFRISNFDVNDGYNLNQIDIDYVVTETP